MKCVCVCLGGGCKSGHISRLCHCLSSGFYNRSFVLSVCCSLDQSGQISFILPIFHRALSYPKHTHTHIHALTHTRSLTDVPVSDYDLIPGKEGTKSPDMLICVHGDYHDFSLEGGCL